MATHSCISNPCWICYPKYAPEQKEIFASIPKEIDVKYYVNYAFWAADASCPDDPDVVPWPSSTDIDDRTVRSKMFPTMEEAEEFARIYGEIHADDPWLAYLEITKCGCEMVKKIK